MHYVVKKPFILVALINTGKTKTKDSIILNFFNRFSLQRLLRGMQRLPDETAPHHGKQATIASSCS